MSDLTKAEQELREYFNECFVLGINYVLYWAARPATHFNGSVEGRDAFNQLNAGRAVTKGPDFTDATVDVNGGTYKVLDIVRYMVA